LAVSVWALGRSGAAEATPNTTASVTPNPEISRWRRWGELPAPRAAFAIANLGELIYIVGGENEAGVLDTVARFDSRSGTWAELSKKGTPATDIQAVVIGGRLYVPGGRRSANQADISDAFERYDPRTETWEALPNVPQPRSAYALATVEGNLYLIGGWDGTRFREEVFEYDPDTQKWTERSPMLTARGFASAAVVADSIYVLGGENESGPLAVNEVYTPSQEDAQPWSRRAPMPQPRSRFGVAAAASTIHVIGGEPGGLPLPAYAARTDSWQAITSSPEPVGSQPGVVLLDTTVLSLGGRTGPGEYATSMLGYQALYSSYLPVTTNE
jgi:N-acetylneuraminic acid mutarotase